MYTIIKAPPIQEDYAEVFLFGDLHYGSVDQDRKLIQECIQYVLNTPNCFAVGVGDTLDLSIKSHFGIIGKDDAIKDALRKFKEDFKELIFTRKFLGTVPGNHDIRITKAAGSSIDLVEEWFHDLKDCGIEIGYGTPHLLINTKVGRSTFTGFITHGSGGGMTLGAIINNAYKSLNEISDSDWYAQGHFHIPVEAPMVERPYYDRRSNTVQVQTQYFLSTSSFQKKANYAAVARMKSGGTAGQIVELYASPNRQHNIPKSIQTRNFKGLEAEIQLRKSRGLPHDMYSGI